MFKGLGNLGNIASMVGAFQELPQKMQELNEKMQGENGHGNVTLWRRDRRADLYRKNGVGHDRKTRGRYGGSTDCDHRRNQSSCRGGETTIRRSDPRNGRRDELERFPGSMA